VASTTSFIKGGRENTCLERTDSYFLLKKQRADNEVLEKGEKGDGIEMLVNGHGILHSPIEKKAK